MQPIKTHGIYRHFKGDLYLVESLAKHCETDEWHVVYRALYHEGQVWIRPLGEFASEVDHKKYPDVQQKWRFELQDIPSVAHSADE